MMLAHGFPVLFGWPITTYFLSVVALLTAVIFRRANFGWLLVAVIASAIGWLYLCRMAWGIAQDGYRVDSYALTLVACGIPPVLFGGISLIQWFRRRKS